MTTIPLLRKMRLVGFRSLPAAEIELDAPTFLIGRNGSGKSNLADAFDFLAEAMASPLDAVFERRGGIAAVGTVRRGSSTEGRPGDMGLMVELENPDRKTESARYAFRLRARKSHGFKVVQEQCVVTRRGGALEWFDRCGDKLESSAESFDPDLEMDALALPLVGGSKRFRSVLRFLSDMRVYRIVPAVLREMQDADDGIRLRSDGSNAASVLREIEHRSEEDSRTIRDLLGAIVPNTVDVQPIRYGNKLSLEFTQRWKKSKKKSKQVTFDALNMSDGTLRALGLLATVFQPRRPSVLVIEEPEATIHPGALGAILDMLRHASRFVQVVVTTHSPDVLDAAWIEDRHLRVVSWEEGVTRVAPLSEATSNVLADRLMGAGELLRSNALTAADLPVPDPDAIRLFEDDLR